MKYLKITIVISLLLAVTIFFSQCLHLNASNDPRGEEYAGSNTCIGCHKDISGSYGHTHHYMTSAPVSTAQLKKMISAPAHDNPRFYYTDSSYVHIEEGDNALLQTYYVDNKKTTAEKIDIAFGSAEKAQTYAYWRDQQLLELPLTWFTSQNAWVTSPGFSARHANYDRVILSRCFECHGSYVKKESVQTGPLSVSEHLDRSSIVFGIDCERCHGPAARHVQFQQDNPTITTAKYITSIKTLSRQQQMDICASCHSGNDLSPQRSLFDFVPGDTLSHFFIPGFGDGKKDPDVHGKQVQLLQASLCYQRSDMTCNTCHNPHRPEQNTAIITKCMDCHKNSTHALDILKDNEQKKRDFNLVSPTCIDCHMPLQTSKTIYFNNGSESKNIPYFIRTHKIAIYQ